MLRRWLTLLVVVGIAGIAVVSGTVFFGEHAVAYEPAGLYAAQGEADASLQDKYAVDQGTFTGDFATCGTNTFPVAAGTQSITVAASAVNPVNDIKLSLLTPDGVEVATVDTGTSPEEIHYSSSSIAAGTWTIEVCPASAGQTNIGPTTYTGAWATQDLVSGTPNPPVVGGHDPTAPNAGTPTATYTAGDLRFSPETVVDPQRTEGEPVNFFAKDGTYWESGPFGTSTQQSWVHKSTDGGLEFHETSPLGLRPDPPSGGGDSDIVTDDQGNVYLSDLEGLTQVSTAVSNDGGNTWKKNALSSQEAGVDRQWYAVDNGTTPSASDNTIFLTYRQIPLGPQILSSPGSTGPADTTGGLVWQNAASGAGALTVSSGAPCGHLIFDPVKRNLYMPCGQGDHIEVVYGHVDPGQRTGIDFKKSELPPAYAGAGDPTMVFPWMAADDAGNLMVVWIDGNDHNVYESVSKDGAQSWTTPLKINSADAKTNEFPEVAARGTGEFVVAWYGNADGGSSDNMPANTAAASEKYPWYGYVADITHADTLQPTVAQQTFTEHPMHYGMVCNQGTTCTSGRTLADYFDVGIDRKGAIRLIFDDESSQYRQAHLMEVRQLLTGSEPKQPMADPTGDAQMPHFSPTGPGPNLPQADFTNLALSQPSKGVLRVQMTVAGGLDRPTPPVGKPQLVWLTRFQAKSTMPASDGGTTEAYRIFYVGAESTEGGSLTFFSGSGDGPTGCLSTSSSGCKIVIYPHENTLTSGTVSGNTITIDVSLQNGFGSGRPIDGDTLYSVTALSYGQNGDADIYMEGDATHSFDYSLGSAPPPAVPQPTAKPSAAPQRIDNGVKNTKAIHGARRVRGHGLVGAGRLGSATFTIGATTLVYVDRRHHLVLRAPIGSVRFGTIAARITGVARVNGKRVRFAAVAVDHGKRGDVFRIAWGGGPSHGGRVRKGWITIT